VNTIELLEYYRKCYNYSKLSDDDLLKDSCVNGCLIAEKLLNARLKRDLTKAQYENFLDMLSDDAKQSFLNAWEKKRLEETRTEIGWR
jgi:hypothetical protein